MKVSLLDEIHEVHEFHWVEIPPRGHFDRDCDPENPVSMGGGIHVFLSGGLPPRFHTFWMAEAERFNGRYVAQKNPTIQGTNIPPGENQKIIAKSTFQRGMVIRVDKKNAEKEAKRRSCSQNG